jgi:hypothetical protein
MARAPTFGYHPLIRRRRGALVVVGAVHHREGRGLFVLDGADGLRALGEPGAVRIDLLLQALRRHPDAERAQPDAVAPHLAVPFEARRRAPQRRVRILQRLRQHPPPRQRPVLALELELVVRPATHHHLERLAPHRARLVGIDAEAFEFGARRRAPGAELDAPIR